MNLTRMLLATSVVVTLATLAGAPVHGAEPEDIIKYRKASMKASAGHLAAATAIVNGKVDYQADLADHVRALAALNRDIAALFPKDSDFGDTEAQEAVWSKNAEFKKRAAEARQRAEAVTKAASGGDMAATGARLRELNDACKACHKDFRKD